MRPSGKGSGIHDNSNERDVCEKDVYSASDTGGSEKHPSTHNRRYGLVPVLQSYKLITFTTDSVFKLRYYHCDVDNKIYLNVY